jgi:hypothetical protein
MIQISNGTDLSIWLAVPKYYEWDLIITILSLLDVGYSRLSVIVLVNMVSYQRLILLKLCHFLLLSSVRLLLMMWEYYNLQFQDRSQIQLLQLWRRVTALCIRIFSQCSKLLPHFQFHRVNQNASFRRLSVLWRQHELRCLKRDWKP